MVDEGRRGVESDAQGNGTGACQTRGALAQRRARARYPRQRPRRSRPLPVVWTISSEDPSVRASAAWALGRIGTSDALTALERHHDDLEPLVRDSVRNALEQANVTSEDERRPGE